MAVNHLRFRRSAIHVLDLSPLRTPGDYFVEVSGMVTAVSPDWSPGT